MSVIIVALNTTLFSRISKPNLRLRLSRSKHPKFRRLVDAIWRLRVRWVELFFLGTGFDIKVAFPLSDSADALAIYSRIENETGTGNFLFKNVSEFMEKV